MVVPPFKLGFQVEFGGEEGYLFMGSAYLGFANFVGEVFSRGRLVSYVEGVFVPEVDVPGSFFREIYGFTDTGGPFKSYLPEVGGVQDSTDVVLF